MVYRYVKQYTKLDVRYTKIEIFFRKLVAKIIKFLICRLTLISVKANFNDNLC